MMVDGYNFQKAGSFVYSNLKPSDMFFMGT